MAWQVLSDWLDYTNPVKGEDYMYPLNGIQKGRKDLNSSLSQLLKILLSTGVVTLPLLFQPVYAQNAQSQPIERPVAYSAKNVKGESFRRRVYGGIGFGASSLEPDTSEVPGLDTLDSGNVGVQLMLGADVNKWVSLEGHFASLGDAELTQNRTIGYSTLGLSALAYAGKSRHNFNRHGFSAFARVGYGYLSNSPSAGLQFEKVNASHLLFGAGLEFATLKGLGARAEFITFDSDISYGQVSLLYRFGKRAQRSREVLVDTPKVKPTPAPVIAKKPAPLPSPKPVPAPVVAPIAAIAVAPADQDADGVGDRRDNCPNTASGIAVDKFGCALFSGVIEGVNFNTGSAELTQNAQSILTGVVATLTRFPTVTLSVIAHTDNLGSNAANKNLSNLRARAVAIFLVRNGISAARLKAFGYGEDQPLDTNETTAGRSRNRRVEFKAER